MIHKAVSTRAWYNRYARQWATHNPRLDSWTFEQRQFRRLLRRGNVLDIGCGFGRDTPFFVKNGYRYLGVDNSEAMIRQARARHPQAKFRTLDMEHIDELAPEKFDGFWAIASFLHLQKRRIPTFLLKLRQVLRPGALGCIALKKGVGERRVQDVPFTRARRFYAFYRGKEFKPIARRAGFQIVRSYERKLAPTDTLMWLIYFVRVPRGSSSTIRH